MEAREARVPAERVGRLAGEADERVVGNSVGEIEPIAPTFEEPEDEAVLPPERTRRRWAPCVVRRRDR